MKRRNLLLSFVAVALLLIGLGYAAIEDTLTVSGTVKTSEAKLDLGIEYVSATFNSKSVAETPVSVNDDTAQITYEDFENKNDVLVVVLKVTNTADNGLAASLEYDLAAITETGDADYFDVSYAVTSGEQAYNKSVALADGASVTVTVTIVLNKTPDAAKTAEFSFTIKGNGVEA